MTEARADAGAPEHVVFLMWGMCMGMPSDYKLWPEALKREFVAASLQPGASVWTVARQYDVNANQVFNSRRRYRDAAAAPAPTSSLGLVPVTITPGNHDEVVRAMSGGL